MPEPVLGEDPAPGPWFRDEHATGPSSTGEHGTRPSFAGERGSDSWPGDEQQQDPWPTAEQPGLWPSDDQQSGPWPTNDVRTLWSGPADQPTPPDTQGPLTLSEPVWVTDFFRNRPPESGAGTFRPALPPRHPPGWAGKVIALAAAVVLLSGGLITWRLVGSHPGPVSAGQPSNGTPKSQPATPVTSSTAASSPASTSPATGPQGHGRDAVALAPALAHSPAAQQVAAVLQAYFHAINQRDYAAYAGLLAHSLRPTMRQFEEGYRSTSDSGAVLTSLSASPRGLAAGVTFISHQAPALSPDHSACTKWDITLYLRRHGTSYLIVPPPHGYHAAHQPCL